MNGTLKSILDSLEETVAIAIHKYKDENDMRFIDLAFSQLTLVNELMKDENDSSAMEFKASVMGMLDGINRGEYK